ncbi:MAG: membrane protein insertase YidC [Micrococcales bacterium]|nr:membrane protein insertase YidC [Micrococcales bacterium]
MGWFDSILSPIMWLVAWIMYGSHKAFALVFGAKSSVAWILAIVMLVVVMRMIMIPLFVKQIRSSRAMQLIQPEVQRLQKRYKGKTDPVSKRRQQEELMALYKKHGANPLSSCLPILAQSPFFFALFRVLYSMPLLQKGIYKGGSITSIGPIDAKVAGQVMESKLFGAPLSATFMNPETWAGAPAVTVRIVTMVLIVAMSVTTFTTQRQLTMKNVPAMAADNPMYRTQKIMLYGMPLIFFVTGVNFPIGVLIYWLTTNLWSMGQQFFVIRRMPTPGTEAEKRLEARKAKRRAKRGEPDQVEDEPPPAIIEPPSGQRVQPKRTSRADRKGTGPKPGGPKPEPEPASAVDGPSAGKKDTAKRANAGGQDSQSNQASGSQKGSQAGPNQAKPQSGQRQQPKKTSRKQRK